MLIPVFSMVVGSEPVFHSYAFPALILERTGNTWYIIEILNCIYQWANDQLVDICQQQKDKINQLSCFSQQRKQALLYSLPRNVPSAGL
jgi:hypothetical protein